MQVNSVQQLNFKNNLIKKQNKKLSNQKSFDSSSSTRAKRATAAAVLALLMSALPPKVSADGEVEENPIIVLDEQNVKSGEITTDDKGISTITTYDKTTNSTTQSKFMQFHLSNGNEKFIFESGNKNNVEFSFNDDNSITASISRGSLSDFQNLIKTDDGLYKYNDELYATLADVALKMNEIELSLNDSFDYTINQSYQRLNSGDCWLLAGVNSLSYTQKGAEIIKNALTYNEDGSVDVYFKGLDETFHIDASEVDDNSVSVGDRDMRMFELASKKAIQKVTNGTYKVDKSRPYYIKDQQFLWSYPLINGGWPGQIWYFLTGDGGTKDVDWGDFPIQYDNKQIHSWLEEFEQTKNVALVFLTYLLENTTVHNDFTGITLPAVGVKNAFDGNDGLVALHTYSVKDVNIRQDGTYIVTLINPWDSGKEIVLTEDELCSKTDCQCCLNLNNLSDEVEQYYIKQ